LACGRHLLNLRLLRKDFPETRHKNAKNARNSTGSKEKGHRACSWDTSGPLSYLDIWLSFVEQRCDEVIKTCVIFHNLIIDYRRINNIDSTYIDGIDHIPSHPFTVIPQTENQEAKDRTIMMAEMKDTNLHNRLQRDLMIEMWDRWNAMNDEGDGNDSDSDAGSEHLVDI
jgi:hypothetical protein